MNQNGGPAFPVTESTTVGGIEVMKQVSPGMALRDYFAGQALAGYLANELLMPNANESAKAKGESLNQFVAATAYKLADAMLEERSRT